MFLLLLWQGKRKREFSAILPLCILLLAGILVLNQSLLTGHEAEFSSHYQKILIVPLTMSALLAISFFLRKPRTEFAFFLAVTLAIIFSTIHVESDESAKWTAFCPTRNSRVAFEEEIHQLNNLPKEQVVLTTLKAADDLMIYTNHYPFFSEQDYMYGASDAELLKRGIIQHDLVPSQPIPPRDIFGTYAVNKALNLTQQCRVLSLFLRSRESCAVAREQFLPHGWQDSIDSQLSARQILEALKKAHVTYALLPSVPPALKNYTEILQHFPDLLLLRLNYP